MNKLDGERTINFAAEQYNPINAEGGILYLTRSNGDEEVDRDNAIRYRWSFEATIFVCITMQSFYPYCRSSLLRNRWFGPQCSSTVRFAGRCWVLRGLANANECSALAMAEGTQYSIPSHRILLPKTSNYLFRQRFSMFSTFFCCCCCCSVRSPCAKLFLCSATQINKFFLVLN